MCMRPRLQLPVLEAAPLCVQGARLVPRHLRGLGGRGALRPDRPTHRDPLAAGEPPVCTHVYPWPPMCTHVYIPMATHGYILATCGYILATRGCRQATHGHPCIPMATHGHPCRPTGTYCYRLWLPVVAASSPVTTAWARMVAAWMRSVTPPTRSSCSVLLCSAGGRARVQGRSNTGHGVGAAAVFRGARLPHGSLVSQVGARPHRLPRL